MNTFTNEVEILMFNQLPINIQEFMTKCMKELEVIKINMEIKLDNIHCFSFSDKIIKNNLYQEIVHSQENNGWKQKYYLESNNPLNGELQINL